MAAAGGVFRSQRRTNRMLDGLAYLIVGLVTLFAVFPLVWTLLTSFKLERDIVTVQMQYIPRELTFDNYVTRLTEATELAADVAAELTSYLDALDADPARLQAVYERRAALKSLTRKYAEDVDAVIEWADRARTRLSELDTSDELLEELDRELVALIDRYLAP